MIRKVFKILKNPRLIIFYMINKGFFNFMDDKIYLKMVYKLHTNRKLNLKNPQTFNEKLQWLKLNDRKNIYTKMVDKYEVRGYIKEKIGEEYLIPLCGVYDKFDEIDFDKLPNQFVLKTTHDSGGVVICKDKNSFNIDDARKKLNKHLNRNFYYCGREWPYKNVKPRIICEKYMIDENNYDEIIDYKFMCFNGEVKCLFTCSNRNSDYGLNVDFYDLEWNKLPFERVYPRSDKLIKKPLRFSEMIQLSEILSKDNIFLRVDFYEINQKIYFGELTFYPGCGFETFEPEEWDKLLGDWIDLSSLKN